MKLNSSANCLEKSKMNSVQERLNKCERISLAQKYLKKHHSGIIPPTTNLSVKRKKCIILAKCLTLL